MRKQRSDAACTLDTQVVINNRRESIFRHLEDGNLRAVMINNYNGRKGFVAYVADIVESPGLHWRLSKESYITYTNRKKHFNPDYTHVCLDYDLWID